MQTAAIEELYNKNCSICHGKTLEGRPGMAPALVGLQDNWKSVDELERYLSDPQGYADQDKRLDTERGKYSMRMPAIPTMSYEDRVAMATWLLAH